MALELFNERLKIRIERKKFVTENNLLNSE